MLDVGENTFKVPQNIHHLSDDSNKARMWKSVLQSVDEQIINYKDALIARGVPDCKWLKTTLAHHRSKMLEKCSRELDQTDSGNNTGMDYEYPTDYSSFYDKLAETFRSVSLSSINPSYSKSPEWRNNCQRCVPTLELRRRGSDVTARPSTYGSDYLSYHPFDVWKNPDVKHGIDSGMDDIKQSMEKWGNGARAQVVVYWDSPHGGGHTFYAEQINGKTVFTDPQTNSKDVSFYFERVVPNTTRYCRIDDLEFSNRINDCYKEV